MVIYCSDIGVRSYWDKDMGVKISWQSDLLSGYRHIFLPESAQINNTNFLSVDNPSIIKVLNEFRPQVVQLNGYAQLTLLRALFWCKVHGVPVIMWSDSELLHVRSVMKGIVKQIVLRPLLSCFSAFLTVGENNETYFQNYGIKKKKMFRTPFTIDEKTFLNARERKNEIRYTIRKELFIPENAFVVFMVGKFIKRKRPGDLIEALKHIYRFERSGSDIYAIFAGNGNLMQEIETQSQSIKDKVRFLGFVNVDKLPEYYMMSDALAHLSEVDPHPLTNSEAIISGLPLVISDKIGTVGETDVARPGKNAIVCPCGDIQAIADAVVNLADDKVLYNRMSNASLKIASELNLFASVKGFLKAVQSVS
jgi:glycosyltransferase involved in cell wall biosynthesis